MKNSYTTKYFSEEQLNSLKKLVHIYYNYQDNRISLDGQLDQKKDKTPKKNARKIDPDITLIAQLQRDQFMKMEEDLGKKIAKIVKQHPFWNAYLKYVPGLGPQIAAVILTTVDIYKATTVSKLWAYCGIATGTTKGKKVLKGKKDKNGRPKIIITDTDVPIDKKTKGFLCPFNSFLKKTLSGNLADSFLRSKEHGYFHKFYYDRKKILIAKDWGTASPNPVDKNKPKAGHQNKGAKRYMIKMFTQELHIVWRTFEELEVRPPFQEEKLGVKHSDNSRLEQMIEMVNINKQLLSKKKMKKPIYFKAEDLKEIVKKNDYKEKINNELTSLVKKITKPNTTKPKISEP